MRAWQRLRRRVLTPDVAQTKIEVRGFHLKDEPSRERLETVGSSFLGGFAAAAEATGPPQAAPVVEATPAAYRGFAYEGAAMAFAIRDALPGRRYAHVSRFLADHDEHVYMAYVGVGWAMARLPRPLWARLYAPDPLLRWLVLDGYGFHQAYFKTTRYVHQRFREASFPWPAGAANGYAVRAIDQGIGRATWFVAGTDPEHLVRLFDTFPEHRRPDLYAGAGLAVAYAGGGSAEEMRWLCAAAGEYRADLAQGAAFAAAARERAGLVMPHNELAAQVLCGLSVSAATRLTDEARVGLPADGVVPAYEIWRQRCRSALAAVVSETRAETA
ncbi:DUF1702 family protein [Dactylosporangium sp. NPDC051484]|uniref:DUF1702 family protein n=1 Tax=Dactylosporangium sp. NPDC051484 TaxID=3154942 RepID=UPI00344B3366